MIKDVISCK